MSLSSFVSNILLLVLPISAACAQPATAPDTARVYKHHLGLTASPQLDHFFTANRSLPIGLLYRQQTRPNRAWRARVVGQYDFDQGTAPLQIGRAYSTNTMSLEGAFGQEKALVLGAGFTGYVGLEIGISYFMQRADYNEYITNVEVFNPGYPSTRTTAVLTGKKIEQSVGGFVQPFLGLRYMPVKRIGVEIEGGISFSFSHFTYREKAKAYDVNTGQEFLNAGPVGVAGNNNFNKILIRYLPISRVHLFFLF